MPAAKQGVDDMSAIELPYWQEVKESHEQTEPASQSDGVEDNADIISRDAKHETRERGEQERTAQDDTPFEWIERTHFGEREPQDHCRDSKEHPGPRPGGADVKQRPAVGRRRFHADEGAKGPDQERGTGNEIG